MFIHSLLFIYSTLLIMQNCNKEKTPSNQLLVQVESKKPNLHCHPCISSLCIQCYIRKPKIIGDDIPSDDFHLKCLTSKNGAIYSLGILCKAINIKNMTCTNFLITIRTRLLRIPNDRTGTAIASNIIGRIYYRCLFIFGFIIYLYFCFRYFSTRHFCSRYFGRMRNKKTKKSLHRLVQLIFCDNLSSYYRYQVDSTLQSITSVLNRHCEFR